MADPTRPLPNLIPQPDGSWTGRTVLTPTSINTRGLFTLPSPKVVPVIVIPGIMGTNLRAAEKPGKQRNRSLHPGEKAWRPPNGPVESIMSVYEWKNRSAGVRQKILDGCTLEVDNRGGVHLPLEARNYGLTESEVRDRFWGEVHWDSYGDLLYCLQVRLNRSFEIDPLDNVRVVCRHWQDVMDCDPHLWGVRAIDKITESELEKHANYHFPVYACGYNWLESCDESAARLQKRIQNTISFWSKHKRECNKVILVSHSMGGLVARACAKQIPDQILGVIHAVMPTFGAPVCYRRIACGTENSNPSNNKVGNKKAELAADILGDRPELTMPVMATSPGVLQLLPNHLYPDRWLHASMLTRSNNKDLSRQLINLPKGNPYDLYRDINSWYRLVDPELADPSRKYLGGETEVRSAIRTAVDQAERFHRDTLGTYYHPNSYAIYGADSGHKSFGTVSWIARDPGNGAVFTEANIGAAVMTAYDKSGGRQVRVENKTILDFVPARQDVDGDGTVPAQSGAGPLGKVRQLFEVPGIDHQGVFNSEAVQLLTQHLVVKLTQGLP